MNLFGKKSVDDSEIVKQLQSTVAQLEASNDKLRKQIYDHKQTIESFDEAKSGYESKIKELTAQHGKDIEQAKAQLESEKKSVARRVNQTLAKMGVNEFAPEEITGESKMNAADIYEKWKSLSGYEKGKYFKENELTIKAFQKEHFNKQ